MCDIHPDTEPICPACIGGKGGRTRSPAKTKAARLAASVSRAKRMQRKLEELDRRLAYAGVKRFSGGA
jgi:hypothetical protein